MTGEAIQLQKKKKDGVVEEKENYAMVTGLLQVWYVPRAPESKDDPLFYSFDIKVASIAYQRYVMCAVSFCSQ